MELIITEMEKMFPKRPLENRKYLLARTNKAKELIKDYIYDKNLKDD